MSKKIAALIVLAACALPAAQAAPGQDEIEKYLLQKGLVSKLGDSIHEATDRAAALVNTAMGALGVRYRLGGTSAETGFDCSGLVLTVFQQSLGLKLPRTAAEQAAATTRIEKAELKPGDLVFFNTLRRAYSHVGIYVGEGKFIHAPRTGAHVRVENMNISYWQTRFNGARRVLDDDTSTAAATTAPSSVLPRVLDRASPAPTTVRLGSSSSKPATAPQPSRDDYRHI